MEVENENTRTFAEDIEDLYRLHYITNKHEHIIQFRKGEWRLFEPTKFIYAYFAFNTMYNFEWEESIKLGKLVTFSNTILGDEEKSASESVKYKSMIEFIFKRVNDVDKDEFVNIILKNNRASEMMQALERITPDSRISSSEIRNFIKEFRSLIDNRSISKSKLKNDILWFIYLVRNNIFHGTKDTIEMAEIFQRKRLDIYTRILIATNDLLFKALQREGVFVPKSKYYLK